MRDLKTQIDEFVINTEARLLGVIRQSLDDLIDEAQTTRAKGGRMRVDTGFLRASGVAALNKIPVGSRNGRRRNPNEVGIFPENSRVDEYSKYEPINVVLSALKIGDAFYFGWTAHYAKIREVYDGFLETSLQNWQSHVDKAVNHFREKDMRK